MKKITMSLCAMLVLMLASFTAGVEYVRGDVDQDGKVGIADVTCLIDYLLTGSWDNMPEPQDEHEWVDLGLPSGTLWATCNVGASCPEEFGDYFAWGETEPKELYYWGTYKWCNGSSSTLTKYCFSNYYGTVDRKSELDLEDDAAYVNWGENWRMPSFEQQQELADCPGENKTLNGVYGRLYYGYNGNRLFMPFAGYCYFSTFTDEGLKGYYWTRSLDYVQTSGYAYIYLIGRAGVNSHSREDGLSVRAVRISQN